MPDFRVTTPSRLHFGLLAHGPAAPRQFGGVGLMIDRPGIDLTVAAADAWRAEGPLADRALRVAQTIAERLASRGHPLPPLSVRIDHAPPEHVGLGTGTQLSLALARALARLAGLPDPSVTELADLSGRGRRSGIGLHGFLHGGLLVDGGRRSDAAIPPLLARLDFPDDWDILLVIPQGTPGLHGADETRAFAELPPFPDRLTDHLCRLVLLGLLPAVAERDLPAFGAALEELQAGVGELFAPAQGGRYASPAAESIIRFLHARGLHGVGQSSWGPAIYAFGTLPPPAKQSLLSDLTHSIPTPLTPLWTLASKSGHRF